MAISDPVTKRKGEPMEHFANEDWIDFAREVVSDGKRQATEEHWNTGCDTYRATLHLW